AMIGASGLLEEGCGNRMRAGMAARGLVSATPGVTCFRVMLCHGGAGASVAEFARIVSAAAGYDKYRRRQELMSSVRQKKRPQSVAD
ncbi:MAG: hypothetical protein NBV65_10905, partial [Burkholderiaceae bacterium]|nr:hypothetical protein [Burkholderiaceae bacterium]